VVLGLGFVLYQAHGMSSRPRGNTETRAYFSDDDGGSFFSDSLAKLPPFDHGGNQAVAAAVFRCLGSGGPPFIGYLERYTPKGLNEMKSPGPGNYFEPNQMQVSLPLKGDKGWANFTSPAGTAIVDVHCPDGSAEVPQQVEP
jgi:hypothetical protein